MSQADKRRGLLQQQALSKGFKVRQQELSGRQRRGWQHLLSWRSLWAGSTLRFSVRVTRQGLSGSGRPATPSLLFAPPLLLLEKEVPRSSHPWLGWRKPSPVQGEPGPGDRCLPGRSRSPSLVHFPPVPHIPHPFPLSLSGWVSFAPHSAQQCLVPPVPPKQRMLLGEY